ncbi:MAG: LamG domain-containing protein [archaeon]|nr:LamG domain-containing protein [archaeon]
MSEKGVALIIWAVLIIIGLIVSVGGLLLVPELRGLLKPFSALGGASEKLVSWIPSNQIGQDTGGEMFLDPQKISEICPSQDIKPLCKVLAVEAQKPAGKGFLWINKPSGIDDLKKKFGKYIDIDETVDFCNQHYPSLFGNEGKDEPVEFYFCSSEAFQQSEFEKLNKPYVVNLGKKGSSTKFFELKGFGSKNNFTANITVFKPSETTKTMNLKTVNSPEFIEKMKEITTEQDDDKKLLKYLKFYNEFFDGFEVIFSDNGAFVNQPLSIFVSPAVKTKKIETKDKKTQYYAMSFMLVLSSDFVDKLQNTSFENQPNFFDKFVDKIFSKQAEKVEKQLNEEAGASTTPDTEIKADLSRTQKTFNVGEEIVMDFSASKLGNVDDESMIYVAGIEGGEHSIDKETVKKGKFEMFVADHADKFTLIFEIVKNGKVVSSDSFEIEIVADSGASSSAKYGCDFDYLTFFATWNNNVEPDCYNSESLWHDFGGIAAYSDGGLRFNEEETGFKYLTYSVASPEELKKIFNQELGTLEFWVKPEWDGGEDATRNPRNFFSIQNREFDIYVEDSELTAVMWGTITVRNISEWKKDEWHQIVVSWGNNKNRLYIDGMLVNENGGNGAARNQINYSAFYIGNSLDKAANANSVIDEFKIYDVELTQELIALTYEKERRGQTASSEEPPAVDLSTTLKRKFVVGQPVVINISNSLIDWEKFLSYYYYCFWISPKDSQIGGKLSNRDSACEKINIDSRQRVQSNGNVVLVETTNENDIGKWGLEFGIFDTENDGDNTISSQTIEIEIIPKSSVQEEAKDWKISVKFPNNKKVFKVGEPIIVDISGFKPATGGYISDYVHQFSFYSVPEEKRKEGYFYNITLRVESKNGQWVGEDTGNDNDYSYSGSDSIILVQEEITTTDDIGQWELEIELAVNGNNEDRFRLPIEIVDDDSPSTANNEWIASIKPLKPKFEVGEPIVVDISGSRAPEGKKIKRFILTTECDKWVGYVKVFDLVNNIYVENYANNTEVDLKKIIIDDQMDIIRSGEPGKCDIEVQIGEIVGDEFVVLSTSSAKFEIIAKKVDSSTKQPSIERVGNPSLKGTQSKVEEDKPMYLDVTNTKADPGKQITRYSVKIVSFNQTNKSSGDPSLAVDTTYYFYPSESKTANRKVEIKSGKKLLKIIDSTTKADIGQWKIKLEIEQN